MKKILLSSLAALTLGIVSANAEMNNLSEVSPLNFNKQVFAVSMGMSQYSIGDSDINSYGDSLQLVLSNKATLHKFFYKTGEIYWRGQLGYDFPLSGSNYALNADIGVGMTLNFDHFYLNGEVAGVYSSVTNNDIDNTVSNFYPEFTAGIGIPIGKNFEIGAFGTYYQTTAQNVNVANSPEYDISVARFSIPVTYKADKDIFINFKYSTSVTSVDQVSNLDINQDKFTIGIAWQYDN